MAQEELVPLPEYALLSCIKYRITEHEGMIVFTEDGPMWGCFTRIMFWRVESCWYMDYDDRFEKIMVSHVTKAYEIVKHYRGGNFEKRNGPIVEDYQI